MAAVDNGDIIIVIGVVIVLSQVTENVFALKAHTSSSGATVSETLAAAQAYMKAVYDPLRPQMSSLCSFYNIKVSNKTKGTDIGATNWDTSGSPGLGGGELLPTGVAALVTFPTANIKTRGRKFFPGFQEGALTAGHWSSGAMSGLVSAATVLLTRVTAGIVSGVQFDYQIVVEGVGAFAYYAPSGASVPAVPAYQRRRKEGVGI